MGVLHHVLCGESTECRLVLLKEGKSEGFVGATGLVFLLKIGFKSLIFGPM